MIAGRIKCDFCEFIGEMTSSDGNKGAVKVPDGWIGIHPTVSVYGMRGLERKDPRYEVRSKIKEKVLKSVKSIHCCPRCANDRDVFSNQEMLPPPMQERQANAMRTDQTL